MKMANDINMVQTQPKRSEILVETLKGRNITIVGHDNIDVDATVSGILMSKLLDFLEIENQFVIVEKVKRNETYEILERLLGINMEKWGIEGENENRELLLVDHYETIHKGKVIACIDHHPNMKEKHYKFKYIRNSCATAYLIYEIMKEVEYPIEKEIAKMIVVAMLIDTVCFRSSKTVLEEVGEAKKLAEEYDLDYGLLEKSCFLSTPIETMSVSQIVSNGQKWHNYNGNKVGSSYAQLYGKPDEETIDIWLKSLTERLNETYSDMLVFIITDTQDSKTYEYRITKNGIQKFIRNGIKSRGNDIMPAIEKLFL